MTTFYRDAKGSTCKEQYECFACYGRGTEYGETCLSCGGFGWFCWTDEEPGPDDVVEEY